MEKNDYKDTELEETNLDTQEEETQEEGEEGELDYKKLYEAEIGRRRRAEKEAKNAKDSPKETLKETLKEKVSTDNVQLTTAEIIALAKAEVSDEDIEEIMDYSKFKNISVKEALNSSVVKTLLKEKAEHRKSEEVSYSGTARKGTAKVSNEAILANAQSGVNLTKDELRRLAEI